MGQLKFKQAVTGPGFSIVETRATTGTIIANRVVKLTSANEIKHTTGSSGRVPYGVALTTGTTAAIHLFGIVDIVASSRAIKRGDQLRATSGAVGTTTWLGGTVRTSTNAMTTAAPIRHNIVGTARTSAAAGTTRRVVSVFFRPTINNPALL